MNRCVFAIATNTAREVTRQTVFYCIAFGGMLLILFSFSFTLFAFGEEARMVQEMGISTITMCCICLASLSAAHVISREVEKGTILTLLSKPVNKRSILLGKFLGVLGIVFFAFAIMGIFLTAPLCIKNSLEYHINLSASFANIGLSTLFRLVVSFLPVSIMCAIAIAGSICLPMASNLSCCMFIYVFGNLMNFFKCIFQTSDGSFPWYVSFVYAIIPNLEIFNTIGMETLPENIFSLRYLALPLLYAVLYVTFIITMACEFFDKKQCS